VLDNAYRQLAIFVADLGGWVCRVLPPCINVRARPSYRREEVSVALRVWALSRMSAKSDGTALYRAHRQRPFTGLDNFAVPDRPAPAQPPPA